MFEKFFAEMKDNARKQREWSKTHCGGCAHDCPLSNPGCGVGKEAAARAKRKNQEI